MYSARSRRFAMAAAFVIFAHGASRAEQAPACDEAQTQLEMNECYATALAGSDSKLNALYRSIQSRLAGNTAGHELLVEAQRHWIAFRDAECAFEASAVEGGSIQPMIRSICLKTLTDRRVEDFEKLLTCEEGDTSCPVPPA